MNDEVTVEPREVAPTSAEGREAAPAPTSPEPRRAGQPLSGRVAYGLAALSGLLYALACPGFDAWPLALVAQVPLILALRGQTPKRATGLGWVAGLVMCVVGFYWLRELLITFAHLPVPLPSLGMVVVAAYQAGRMALVGLVFGLATRRGWPPLPVFAAAFISAELVYPELFPWYYAACVHNALPLLQLAEYGGVFLVGALLLAPNLAIAAVLQSWLDRKAEDRPPLSQRLVGAGLLAPILVGGWGLFRIGQIRGQQEEAKSVRVALIQPNMPLVDRKGSLEKHQQMTAEARKKRPELVIWNEGTVLINIKTDRYEDEVQARIAKDLKVPAILGLAIRTPNPPGSYFARTVTTSAVLTDADGAVQGRYDKNYLLMFGEYLPFGDTFPSLYEISPNSTRLTPGTSLAPLHFGEHRLSTTICYEDILPGYVNAMMRTEDPDLLVNLTNDVWFGDTLEPAQHFALAALRTVEQRRYLVRSTNSGYSGIVDATGKVVERGGIFATEIIHGTARYMTGSTLYRRIGNAPWYLLALVTLALCGVRRPGSRA